MMPRWVRFIIPLLLIFVLTVGLVHRIGIERSGRRVNLVSTVSEQFYHLKTVADFIDAGELSLVSGSDIMHLYRAQIPVNPHIFAQLRSLDVSVDKNYLITSKRTVFNLLEDSLHGVETYRDGFNRNFDGHFYPDAFIFESLYPERELFDQPVADLRTENLDRARYLYLKDKNEVDLFFSGNPPVQPLNLIVPRNYDRPVLPERFQPLIKKIYVVGDNIEKVGPGDAFRRDRLNLTALDIPKTHYRGSVRPLGRAAVKFLLLITALIAAYVGFINDRRFFTWSGWMLLLVIAAVFLNEHLLLLGFLVGGLFRVAYCRRLRGIIWLTFAGLLVYSYHITPYLLSIRGDQTLFWTGFIISSVFLVPLPEGWRRAIITGEDVFFAAVIALLAGLLNYFSGLDGAVLLTPGAWLLIFAPLCAYFFSARRDYRRYFFMTIILGWFFLLAGTTGIVVLIGFIIAMIIYVLYIFYLV
ncbi:MAG: hypothetical protein ACLFN5_02950 [bacterium]